MAYDDISIQDIIERRGYPKDIKGDKFSLFISNYPSNARYLRSRLGNPDFVLAELCCSVGISLQYLAPGFRKVIGVDIDREVLEMCKANLVQSGQYQLAELVAGDVFDDRVLEKIKADIVIYDIPYWYPHTQVSEHNLVTRNPPLGGMVNKIRKYITDDIVIFSPPELSHAYFQRELGALELEQVFIGNEHNRSQVYLGNLINTAGTTEIRFDS